MKNIFSFSLYRQGLRKVRGVGIAMAIVIIVLNAIVPILCMVEDRISVSYSSMVAHSVEPVEAPYFAPFGIAVIIFAPILIYSMFSFLNERRSADFYHAIPHKRICVYVSFLMAALTWLIGVLLASSLLNSILWGISRFDEMNFAAFGLSFSAYAITALAMAGFMALAMMLTGSTISNCLVFLLVLLFVRTIGFFFLYCLEDIAPMFVSDTSWLKIFELEFFMPFELLFEGIFQMEDAVFHKGGMMIYWLVVSILLLVVSGVLYVHRRSEWATKSAPNKLLQHVYRIAVTLPFMLLGIVFIVMEGNFEVYHVIFFVLAAVVYSLYELLTTKKIKNLVRSLPLLLVPVALSLVFIGAVHGAKGLIYASIPTEEKIESVSLMPKQTHSVSYEYAVTYGVFVDGETLIRDTAAALQESKEWGNGTFYGETISYYDECSYKEPITYYTPTIIVKLKSGREVAYRLHSTYDISAQIINSEECRAAYLALPENCDIYVSHYGMLTMDESTKGLWESFKAEYEALSDAEKYNYKSDGYYVMHEYATFELSGVVNGNKFHATYAVTDRYTPKTAAIYRDFCNQKYDPVMSLTKFRNLLMDENNEFLSGGLNLKEIVSHKEFNFHDDANMREALNALVIDEHLTDFDAKGSVYRVRLDYGFAEDIRPADEEKYYKDHWVSAEFFILLTPEEVETLYQLANNLQ